jgi:hypothetical protein
LNSVFKDKRADQRSSLRDQPQLDQSWLRARRLRGTLFDYSLLAISERRTAFILPISGSSWTSSRAAQTSSSRSRSASNLPYLYAMLHNHLSKDSSANIWPSAISNSVATSLPTPVAASTRQLFSSDIAGQTHGKTKKARRRAIRRALRIDVIV